ncbi:MAG: protein kinase domain-containing protein [Vicinamibacterales bacterium]
MALSAGARLGPYEILDSLGAGGMGEVYRARDTKLGRSVALKTIPDSFADDAERLARFEREARTLATLNHPHIAQIYGLEESHGARALVMELVDGEDLSQRLARGAIPVREALQIAGQVAEAIEAAHEQGIIHRDLKPANIKVTPDGVVKVLDFGLAKIGPGGPSGPGRSGGPSGPGEMESLNSPTITSPAMTQAGMILGTAAYMSPEQAHGRVADKRSDVWAFGCVLYEMLTGNRAFAGSDVIDTLAAVVRAEPDFSGWPADAPPTIKMLVQSCLTKDRRERVSDIAAARYALRQAATTEPMAAIPAPHRSPRSRERWYVACLAFLLAVVVALSAVLMRRLDTSAAGPKPVVRLSLVPPAELAFRTSGVDRDFAITPDGSHVVYRTQRGLLAVRALDSVQANILPETEGARGPFVSPDGQWVGYWTNGTIRKRPIGGGGSALIAQSSNAPRGHAWGTDNNIIFATNTGEGLQRVSANGGPIELLTRLGAGEQGHFFPSLLPTGHAVLYTILVGGVDKSQIALFDLRTLERKILLPEGSQPVYVEPGYLVFRVSNTLRAVRFDLARAEVLGAPVTLLENVASSNTGSINADVALNGTLAYLPGTTLGVGRTFVWSDRTGRLMPIAGSPRSYTFPRVAPDGVRLAVDSRDQEQDVWITDTRRGTLARLSFGPALDAYPTWTPDGRYVRYASSRDGAQAIYRMSADGTGEPQRLATGPVGEGVPLSVSPDGRSVIVRKGNHLTLLRLDGTPSSEILMQTGAIELNAELSPDGRWLAFDSTESGKAEVYVRPFPKISEGRWQISTAGGSKPVWARNGKELFYEDGTGAIVAAPVGDGPIFSSGVPTKLFDGGAIFVGTTTSRTWDVAPDGRFLLIKDPALDPATAPPAIIVVLNWVEELKAKLATQPR